MSDPIQLAIVKLQAKLHEQERAVAKTKMVINQLCEVEGLPLLYSEADEDFRDAASLSIRSDQFYGQPLAGAIRTILEMRRKQDRGPATVNEIFAALVEGGFAFDTRVEENAKRGLRVSLSKNTAVFHKLPNGKYGLLEWYPGARTRRVRIGVIDSSDTSDSEDASDGDDVSDSDVGASVPAVVLPGSLDDESEELSEDEQAYRDEQANRRDEPLTIAVRETAFRTRRRPTF